MYSLLNVCIRTLCERHLVFVNAKVVRTNIKSTITMRIPNYVVLDLLLIECETIYTSLTNIIIKLVLSLLERCGKEFKIATFVCTIEERK